ncbi:GNAT family N-acetyltransferase [Hellea balneolensis]|uniref:GNAT family N-acetyltransferase n=1 Tax=Hellea balneolensis TaxID=287478 RepID=UPI00138AF791|nr:GNAT family N-acetyltransferase [Hellea balneolensis]
MRDKIETKSLVLRELQLEDAQAFSTLAGDYDIAKMTGSLPHPIPLYSAEFKIMSLRRQKQRGLAYPYAITIDGGELIGVMDLFRSAPDAALELGYWIGKPYWGRGYSTEAAKAIITEARKTLGVKALMAGAFADNPASLRVLEKLGFKPTGEEEMYFSMGRMKKARSISFRLDFQTAERALPLQSDLKLVMSA